MYHYDMYVKVAYDNFNNKRTYDDDEVFKRLEEREIEDALTAVGGRSFQMC